MDLLAVGALSILFAGLAIALLRSVMTRQRRYLFLLLVPLALFTFRWAAFRQRWSELGIAMLAALLLVGAWWLAYGRRLPPPTDDNIRVWTKDDPF